MKKHIAWIIPWLVQPVCAQVRTGGPYAATIEVVSSGGGSVASADYRVQSSIGGPSGISNAPASQIARFGYTGQIFTPVALNLSAALPTVEEQDVRQLDASVLFDDATTLTLTGGDVSWSIASGPLVSVNPAGIVSADAVYQDTAATVEGTWQSLTGSIALTVLDVSPDNFGTYAGDGLPDLWQVTHFGIGSPLATPAADGDGDGQNNLLEYLATSSPTDPSSLLRFRIEPVAGQPDHRRLVFSPYSLTRNYTLEASSTLSPAAWSRLLGIPEGDIGIEHFFIDENASDPSKFYRLIIEE